MERKIEIIEGFELQKRLEPLYELNNKFIALKEDINKKASTKYLTIKQVCDLLHISRSTLYRITKNGDIKARKVYKRVLYVEQEINDFLITINQ